MKLMFASDIHGSAYYCRKMLEAYQAEEADRLILLGDNMAITSFGAYSFGRSFRGP